VMAWLAPVEGSAGSSSTCRRIPVAPGVELLMDEQHPALRLNGDPAVIAEALRQALASVIGLESHQGAPPELRGGAEPGWTAVQPEPEMVDTSSVSTERPG
jgi:hypothetical protein